MVDRGQRWRGFHFGRALVVVVALHILAAGGGLWLAKTQSGQLFARVYKIKLIDRPKPEAEELKFHEPSPADTAPPAIEAPRVAAAPLLEASAPVVVPAASTPGGGETNWNGEIEAVGAEARRWRAARS